LNKKNPLFGKTIKDFDFIKRVPVFKKDQSITVAKCKELFKEGHPSVALINGDKFVG
jgi:hypothetical protein